MFKVVMFIIILTSKYQVAVEASYPCGGAKIRYYSICVCGDKSISRWDTGGVTDYSFYHHEASCCGRDTTCYVKPDGSGHCPDGQLCTNMYTFRCGDIRLPEDGVCQCGEEKLTSHDYAYKLCWCCPSSPSSCSYNNGTGVCINGTVNIGHNARCPTGSWDRHYIYCKDDGKQVESYKICHGSQLCKDGSDLEQCKKSLDYFGRSL